MADAASNPGLTQPGGLECAGHRRSWRLQVNTVSSSAGRRVDRVPSSHPTFLYRRLAHHGADVEAVTVRRAPANWTEFHETFTVCTIESGEPVHWRLGTQRFTRTVGVGMLVGPGQLHVDPPTSGEATYRILRIAPELIDSAARRLGMSMTAASVAKAEVRESAANELFLSVHRALEEGEDDLVIRGLLDACLAEVARRCVPGGQRSEREPIRRAREHIVHHLADPITLDGLAAAIGMRKWGLVTLFRRHIGVPPLRYVVQVRVARARTLLGTGRYACAVASEVGFFDQSHLNRWFRRTYGVTPGEYQRAVLSPSSV